MNQRREILIDILEKAIDSLICEEATYILSDVSERSVCARLAYRLEKLARGCRAVEQEFADTEYFADVENNRKQAGQIKTILDDDWQEVRVTCDLILHSRGASNTHDNLIAVEMTKSNRPEQKKDSDRSRLRALTKSRDEVFLVNGPGHPEHVCGYKLGAFLEFNLRQRSIQVEYFKNGNRVSGIKTIPIGKDIP